VTRVVRVEGPILDWVLDSAQRSQHEKLSRSAYRRFDAALARTVWGARCRSAFALADGDAVLASADTYDLAGWLDGRVVRVCGIGSVFTEPTHGRRHAQALIETLVTRATQTGAELALLFTHPGLDDAGRDGFNELAVASVTLEVAESQRHGAPMTMIRAGEERDLAAIVAMGRVRAETFGFHLDRDVDFVRYAITRNRLLAGLGTAGARQLHFFIAEEGTTAAAYIVLSVEGRTWTVEECGDRDSSGARVGALLQGLIARERTERPVSIRAWLPPGFMPPQVTIVPATPSMEGVMVRALGPTGALIALHERDILYWRSDVF
jgi:hypothetical protein